MVTLTIDNRTVTVPEGTTILEAARSVRLDIPTLCYLKDINEIGACRICVVEVKGGFAAGDAVWVDDEQGNHLAKGLVGFDSEEIRRC